MAEAVVGTIIQVVLDNLLTISQEQISLVRHFKDDLETLKESFSMVQDFLHDAEEKQVKESAVKRWLRDLEALAFDADNVLDEINYQLLSKKVGATRNKTAKKKVQSFFSNNNPIAYRLKMGRRIREINEKLKSINQQAIGFGLQTIVARAPVYVSDASVSIETDSFSEDPVTLGRENDVSRIVEMLIITSPTDRKLSVLPIVGMGGLGKTTLARLVFGHAYIKTRFETHVWVHVPRNFDVLVLLKKIFTSMTTENVEHGNREALLKKLRNNLGTQKYLLVMDDVWNEDREKWDDFVKSFSGISSVTGNCMIVTTRSEVVASIVETLPVHKLKGLSDDDCWLIIKAKAFRGGDNPLEFETIGRNIAKRCKGLPLAAKVFGGLLLGKSKDEWLGFEKKPLSNFGDGDYVYKILKLSFDNLSSPSLKKCFAYCSIFPKGDLIEKEEMIELWMAEGFLQIDHQRSNLNMEATGSKFVNILLQNSLLQVFRRYDEYFNLHDLVHDVASSVFGENDNVTHGTCRRYVRRLNFNIGKASDFRFSDFESLHILTLWGRDIDDLPTSIRELKHLRYLDISKTKIKCLPESIGELYHLQTLRAQKRGWHSYFEKLPQSLSNLISLRHLHIPDKTTLPPGIGKLTSLQSLSYFNVRDKKGFRISELGSLKDLKGRFEIHNLEKVSDKSEAMSADLLGKTGIYELRLMWGESRGHEANEESVLEGLQPHPNLKSLNICGFKGKSLPQWTLKMAVQLDVHRWEGLDNLTEITLRFCGGFGELPTLGHLPHLKSLHLRDLTNVRFIGSSFYGVDSCRMSSTISTNGVDTIDVFRALETLELRRLPILTEWAEVGLQPPFEVRVFPCLKDLTIIGCNQLIRVPSHFPCLERLDIGYMESTSPLENICGTKTTSLTILEIYDIQGLKCLPDGLFSNNHNLSKLEISSCPNMTHVIPCLRGGGASLTNLLIEDCSSLRELPHDLHSLDALEKFEISNCPDLKSIPYPPSSGGGGQQQGFTSLRELRIRNCGGLTNLPIEMVESLEELGLYGLSSTINIPKVIGCMRCLTSLSIVEVPEYRPRKTYHLRIHNLQRLVIGLLLDSSWNNISFSETVDAMLLQCIYLRGLELTGVKHLECLPDQLQHLTSLEELWLSSFGMEALPEWFGNFSFLKSLILNDCKKLRHLPSKQAMLRLSKLTVLSIRHCPLLLKEKRSNTDDSDSDSERSKIVDSECSKISHIATVSVV